MPTGFRITRRRAEIDVDEIPRLEHLLGGLGKTGFHRDRAEEGVKNPGSQASTQINNSAANGRR